MTVETQKFDPANYLETPQDIAAYLEAVLEDGDEGLLKSALGTIARAKGMTALARDSDLTRAALYKAFSPKGDPKLSTLMRVFKALDLKISIEAVKHAP